MVFNSFDQWMHFKDKALSHGISCGIRLNPACSTQEGHAIYDPCAPGSRLGVTKENFRPELLDGLEGLHFHTLCEQNSDALVTTLAAIEEQFGEYLPRMKWLNFGGGHHITRPITTSKRWCGKLNASVKSMALRSIWSPVRRSHSRRVPCCPPAGYRPQRPYSRDFGRFCRMPYAGRVGDAVPAVYHRQRGGRRKGIYLSFWWSDLSGRDIIGDYSFDHPLQKGEMLVFTDMAIYSFVKNNTFNGMPLRCLRLIRRKTASKSSVNSVTRIFGCALAACRRGPDRVGSLACRLARLWK